MSNGLADLKPFRSGGGILGVAKPTEAQKESGNYKKAHVKIHGLDIAIENPRGSLRSGIDANGKKWSVKMPDHYGYFKKTEGKDGDAVDCYVGPDLNSDNAFIIDQKDAKTGAFDEHKVMLGYSSKGAAKDAYERAFSDGKGMDRLGAITTVAVADLRAWLRDGNTKKPAARQGFATGGVVRGQKPQEPEVDEPLVDRASMLPIGQYADGSLTLAWPGMIKDTYDSLVNSYGDVAAGRTPRTQDVLNVASAPMMGNFAAKAAGIMPEGALGVGASKPPTGGIRAYHGTGAEIAGNRFDVARSKDIGPHFGTPEQASNFARGRGETGGAVYPVSLDFKNPVDLPDLYTWRPSDVARTIETKYTQHQGIYDAVVDAREAVKSAPGWDEFAGLPALIDAEKEALRRSMIERGIDGIRYQNGVRGEGAGSSYIAVAPGTVRSATTGETLFSNPAEGSLFSLAQQYQDRDEKANGGGVAMDLPPLSRSEPIHVGPLKSDVAGRTDHLPISVPAGSFVVPADIVSALGEGNSEAGMKVVEHMFPHAAPKREYAAGGKVPIMAAGGEIVLSPEQVAEVGGGDIDAGHDALDLWVTQTRANTIETLKRLPGPARD
jgi:hypothetical protein